MERSLQEWNNKLSKWGMSFPAPPKPLASYVPYKLSGDLLYTSGALPMREGSLISEGFVGRDLNLEEGQQAARWAVLNALAAVFAGLQEYPEKSLRSILQITGYVQSGVDFHNQHLVLNGASDLLIELLGDSGRHTRIAVGVSSLPLNAPVEISMIAQLH